MASSADPAAVSELVERPVAGWWGGAPAAELDRSTGEPSKASDLKVGPSWNKTYEYHDKPETQQEVAENQLLSV